ncbi:acyltransferase [Xenorhabdus sp. Reich]|uniref:Acyltransferase n=1 Tax=Xenorhabdus littoralis TaxID=2582835 RepID=A0ABU4SHV5_9GAMM|nr:acyltransferase [Xenorhabdus sp. Reich]MDX7998176.1 acyltransferase [Xenorhabdus sp. Reich]
MMKRFESLDAFRGIWALVVVARHLHIVGAFTEIKFFRNCYMLVEFFFALSGFVLAHSYAYKESKFIPYISSRFLRIFPLHIFMLLIFISLEFCRLLIHQFSGIEFDTVPFTGNNSLSEILPNLFLVQSWTSWTHALSFNYPSWSLSIEFYVYILFYLTIVICRKINTAPIVWTSIFIVSLWLLVSGNDMLQQAVNRGLSCFFGGAFTYSIFRMFSGIKINTIVASILEAICLILILFFTAYEGDAKRIICTSLFLITIFVFAYQRGVFSHIFRTKYLRHLGNISCSIYMIHAVIILIFTTAMYIIQKTTSMELTPMIGGRRYLDTGSLLLNNIIVLIIISIIIAISTITYNKVEMKFIKYKKK